MWADVWRVWFAWCGHCLACLCKVAQLLKRQAGFILSVVQFSTLLGVGVGNFLDGSGYSVKADFVNGNQNVLVVVHRLGSLVHGVLVGRMMYVRDTLIVSGIPGTGAKKVNGTDTVTVVYWSTVAPFDLLAMLFVIVGVPSVVLLARAAPSIPS